MGLLGCSSPFFQMQCDIYFANEIQDKYGKVEKRWMLDHTQRGSFYTLGDKNNYDNFSLEDKRFYKLETMLYGRVQDDPRKDSSGFYHPLSHVILTNVRGGTCSDTTFWVETNGDYVGKPTIFEIKTCQPFVGPFNRVEYWKIQLERSDTQEPYVDVYC